VFSILLAGQYEPCETPLELHARSYSSRHMDKLCVRHGQSFDRAASEHRALSGAGVAVTDRQCFGTSFYATPGESCALSTNMASEKLFHRFSLFADPIWPDKRAPGAPCLPCMCDIIHKRF